MSHIAGNEHYDYATAAFAAANAKAGSEFNDAVRADAMIQANLAIAHEQRTANLIAVIQTSDYSDHEGSWGITNELRSTVFNEIAIRLGLEK